VAQEWKRLFAAWEARDPTAWAADAPTAEEFAHHEFWEWHGDPPDRDSYRPTWSPDEQTHYQMYETVSEGTPVSPVLDSPEALARWLADTGADAGAGTATYAQWLRVCRGGYAPTFVLHDGRIESGVAALGEAEG